MNRYYVLEIKLFRPGSRMSPNIVLGTKGKVSFHFPRTKRQQDKLRTGGPSQLAQNQPDGFYLKKNHYEAITEHKKLMTFSFEVFGQYETGMRYYFNTSYFSKLSISLFPCYQVCHLC